MKYNSFQVILMLNTPTAHPAETVLFLAAATDANYTRAADIYRAEAERLNFGYAVELRGVSDSTVTGYDVIERAEFLPRQTAEKV